MASQKRRHIQHIVLLSLLISSIHSQLYADTPSNHEDNEALYDQFTKPDNSDHRPPVSSVAQEPQPPHTLITPNQTFSFNDEINEQYDPTPYGAPQYGSIEAEIPPNQPSQTPNPPTNHSSERQPSTQPNLPTGPLAALGALGYAFLQKINHLINKSIPHTPKSIDFLPYKSTPMAVTSRIGHALRAGIVVAAAASLYSLLSNKPQATPSQPIPKTHPLESNPLPVENKPIPYLPLLLLALLLCFVSFWVYRNRRKDT